MFKCRSHGMSAKRMLYEGIVVPTALYGAETWNMGAAERRRLNVMEMRCLRSKCGVTGMDQVRNEDKIMRNGVIRESADEVGEANTYTGILNKSNLVVGHHHQMSL